jgi:hypothetical protein
MNWRQLAGACTLLAQELGQSDKFASAMTVHFGV